MINKFNINEEFLIKNVDGIGKVSITNDFRNLVELNFGPLVSGFCICDEFAKYARLELCLNPEQMLKLDHAMTHCNTKTENLIPINKLILGSCAAFFY